MEKHKAAMIGLAAAVAGIALAGLLWSTNDGRPTSDASSGAPALGKASNLSVHEPRPTATGQNTTAPATPSETGQSSTDNGSPASAGPVLSADLREMIETNRDRLLGTQAELRARIAELREDEEAVPISDQDLLRWSGVLYRDALLARLAHGEPEPSEEEALRGALASAQPTLNSQNIPEPLPSAGDGYGRYLQQLLRALPHDGSEITDAQALDLTLKIQGLLQRRERHSENLFLSDVRSVVLDSNKPVPARIAYVQQFFDVGDDALGQYGAALLADVPDREALTQEDRQAVARLLARARQEKNQ